ncbi:MAG: hypothetical protein ACO1OF_20755 [Adhaeribacter sp.]
MLSSLQDSFFNQFTGLEVAEGGEIRSYYRCEPKKLPETNFTVASECQTDTSEELYFLTQVILNTLNTEPERFHDMFDIPGLETESWEQLANVTQYLIAEGWIEPKAVAEKLLVKLTIEGKLYLQYNNA